MRKRIGIYGVTDESLQLLPLLEDNPEVEVTVLYHPDAEAALLRLRALSPDPSAALSDRLTDDPTRLQRGLHAVIDAGLDDEGESRLPALVGEAAQIVAPLTARLLYGYGASGRDHKGELLQALHEVVESYNLTVDADELFSRMLEIALGVTGADRGSLMLLDPAEGELRIRVAVGIEPELWPKIRVRLGEGIAGKVAADGLPLRLRGRADREAFQIVRERMDVESALSVPLHHEGRVLGVLNLHHTHRADAFSEDDLAYVEQLAELDAQIIARAQEHASLRVQAARYDAVREVKEVLDTPSPLPDRLTDLCQRVAGRIGRGIATVYLQDADADALRLAATSLEGGGFGGEYRVSPGEGIDGQAASTRQAVFLRGEGERLAYAALPLLAGGRLVGLLSLQAGASAPTLESAREGLLEVAAALAEAVARSEREARMTARATKMGAINEMGIRMVSATDTTEVVQLATSSGAMILEADHAVLRLQDDETGRYVIRSYFGSADGPLQEKLFRLDKDTAVDVIKRRAPQLVRHVADDPRFSAHETGVRSFMSAPLRRDGWVIGTLSFYDKVAADSFYAAAFNDEDFGIFQKFASYVERGVANAAFHTQARRHRSVDEETGLPNSGYLAKRIDEELARAAGRDVRFALAVCRVENLARLLEATDSRHVHRVRLRTAEALRRHLRGFDVPARTGEAEFAILLPDPGDDPHATVSALARGVAEDLNKDDDLNEPERVALGFGYAVYPTDGSERDALLSAAGVPRIRMV